MMVKKSPSLLVVDWPSSPIISGRLVVVAFVPLWVLFPLSFLNHSLFLFISLSLREWTLSIFLLQTIFLTLEIWNEFSFSFILVCMLYTCFIDKIVFYKCKPNKLIITFNYKSVFFITVTKYKIIHVYKLKNHLK